MEELTPAERDELKLRRDRADLERLRRDQAHSDFNAMIREAIREAIAPPARYADDPSRARASGLSLRNIQRAYRHDVAGEPRNVHCEHGADEHEPGSMKSVACRFDIGESSLYDARRRLGLDHWPPIEADPPEV